MDFSIFPEDFIQCSLERRNPFPGVDLLQKLSNKRFVRLDETEKPIRVLLTVTAPDPQTKPFVEDRNDPAPVFGKGSLGFKSFIAQLLAQKVSEPFAPEAGIDPLFLSVNRRE
jgi:hypothetical protein